MSINWIETNKDEYIKAIDDEICGDVYYYHNKVNDKVDLYTVGCELSEWDGEKIAYMINTEELKDEIILVNTCAVTEFAQIASEKLADRLYKIYPNKKIYFVGCGVNYNKEYYSKLGIPLTNKEKFMISNYGITNKNNSSCFKLNKHRDIGLVKIEDGCYNNCSYCIIHKIRPHYMMPYEKIYTQIKNLLSQGKKIIQLIGTEICSYNCNGLNLTTLCEKILLDFPEIPSLVLGALDPASKQIDSLIELIKNDKRMNNILYLCTQSCCDEILKKMNRRHNVDRLREINKLAGDDVHLVFQLILGFPGETDELFQETVDVIKELKPIDYDAIVFSPRKGTPAYDMPNRVPTEVTDKRERIIYDLIKSYTFKDDKNTNRSFAQHEQMGINKFIKHKPELSNSIIFYEDLYDKNTVVKLFPILKEYENESKDVVIVTNFDLSKDLFDLDVNIKLLTSTFGVKVVTKFLINDNIMDFISHTYWIPNVIMYRIGTYIEFYFEKLERTSEEDIIKLFKDSYLYKIDDIELMAVRLLKSGNSKLFKVVVKYFEGIL
jgi:threonylcarbamoyladenosine tRNA methylthiotransferase MtaB